MNGKILIVDDERAIRKAVRDALSREGHFAVTASSAEEAIRRCKAEAFDLLITDLKMPGLGGLELIREARALLPDIRTILMTAYASTDSAVEALRLEVSDYLVKPFRLSELRFTAARLIEEAKHGAVLQPIEPGEEQAFEYVFGTKGNTLVVSGAAVARTGQESDAAHDAVRMAARAIALYAARNGQAINPASAGEAISDVLYFEAPAPVNLRCASGGAGRRVCATIGAAPSGRAPASGVTTPAAGSFPRLRATMDTNVVQVSETETSTGVLDESELEFTGQERSSQTVSLESDNVDLKYLVEQIEGAAKAAGLNPARTNDIIAAVNEAVLNSIEHAYGRQGAGPVEVAWDVFAGELVATVRDYGEGFDRGAIDYGGGFAAFERLADRAAIESVPGLGTTVYLAKATE